MEFPDQIEILQPLFNTIGPILISGNYGLTGYGKSEYCRNHSMKNYFVSYKNPITACLFIILLGGIFVFSQFKTSLFPEITFPEN